MKNKNILIKSGLTLAIGAMAFIYYGCKKEYNVIDTSGNRGAITEEWVSAPNAASPALWLQNKLKRQPSEQTVSLPTSGSFRVSFPDGLKVDFFAPFTFDDGSTASGSAKATGILLTNKSDFVFNNRPTMTKDEALVSGGSFKVTLSKNGQRVNASYAITLDQSNENFDIFDEGQDSNNNNIWVARDSTVNPPRRTPDTTTNYGKRWCCFIKQRWINCDYWYRNPGKNFVKCFVKTAGFGNNNCRVFCILKNRKVAIWLRGNVNTKQFELPQSFKGLPDGEEVIFVSFATDNAKNKYYFGFEETTIQKNKTYSLNLKEMSESDLKAKLKSFD